MILATLGWGLWWVTLALHRFAPGLYPGLAPVYSITCVLAAVGLFLATFTVRARLIWVLLAAVPFLANASLLLLPLIVDQTMLDALHQEGAEEESAGAVKTIQAPVAAANTVRRSTTSATRPWSLRRAELRIVARPVITGTK